MQAMTRSARRDFEELPAGIAPHHDHGKLGSLFNIPPKLELAAAAAVPLLQLTIIC